MNVENVAISLQNFGSTNFGNLGLTCFGVANVLLSVTELLSDLVSDAFNLLFTSVSTWTSFCTSSIYCFVSKILDTIFSDSCILRSISVN